LIQAILSRVDIILYNLLAQWDCELIGFIEEVDYALLRHRPWWISRIWPRSEVSHCALNAQGVCEKLASYYWESYFWKHPPTLISVGGYANTKISIHYTENQDAPCKLGQPLKLVHQTVHQCVRCAN